jgi:DtxR family transcriptional regulator, Mn-dependent transcriptional regulator
MKDLMTPGLKMPAAEARGSACPAIATAGRPQASCSLCALRLRQPATIHTVTSNDADQVRYLATLGLLPRACIQVEERAPFDGPLLVKVGSARYALGRDVADGIIVAPA